MGFACLGPGGIEHVLGSALPLNCIPSPDPDVFICYPVPSAHLNAHVLQEHARHTGYLQDVALQGRKLENNLLIEVMPAFGCTWQDTQKGIRLIKELAG